MNFIGLQMLVTLKSPPGAQLKGTVSDVMPGSSLVLSNGQSSPLLLSTTPRRSPCSLSSPAAVFYLGTDKWIPRLTIEPGNISDVAEYKENVVDYKENVPPPNTFTAPGVSPVPAPVVSQPAQPAFVDPAIVSLGKRPTSVPRPARDAQSDPQPVELPGPQPGQPGILSLFPPAGPARATGTPPGNGLSKSLQELQVDDSLPTPAKERFDTGGVQETPGTANKKRNRKSKQHRGGKNGIVEDGHIDGSPSQSGQGSRGKGWRQTPILESTASFQPFKSLKRVGKKGMPDNGWASEDVTEEMGEFDFEGGLAKFDKRTIFDQMRKDDTVDEADRLVTHNRKAKPGTAGGKNLHHSENVLDLPSAMPKTADDFWNSEADDATVNGADRLSGRDVRSAQSMRRTESKPGASRRSQSRKASATGVQPMTRTHSAQGLASGFYLQPSGRRAETVSALQMLNLENIAANEIGLTEDMMVENAGRGIAQVAITALKDPAIQVRLGAVGANPPVAPASAATVVILAGNNKSGVRAVAAARHLKNKGVSLLVCVVGIERERDLLEDMKQQVRIFKNLGGRVHSKIDFFDQLRKASHSSSSSSSVTLIIDALLGLAISFEELRTGDQATVYELIEWANRNEAFTLAVDVPTGIDPSTGKVSIIDGSRLYVKPRYVVAMGAPKRGLLEAMATPSSEVLGISAVPLAEEDEWKLFIADIGLGAAVFKKAGTKLRRGIEFEDQWVLRMRYQGDEIDNEADY